MSTKKEYLSLVRWSCMLESFLNYYFIRMIVIYLLSQGVTPWVAVSIPVVLEFSNMISRGFPIIVKLSLKVNYKKYHIFWLVSNLILGLIITRCRTIYTIYIFTIIMGFLLGIKHSSLTKLNTQNKEYEPYCLIEEERSTVIGGTLGLLVGQFVYDISSQVYFIGYIILSIMGTIASLKLKEISNEDVMEPIAENKPLDKKSKKNIVLISTLFGILAGIWCMGLSAFTEIGPLISNKIGYLESVYTILEVILLLIISGSLIDKIRKKHKLLLVETVVACIDVFCLLIAALTLSWQGLLIAYVVTGFSSTLGDPLWGSIMSAYSMNDRTKWVAVNRVYFIVRSAFTLISFFVCREFVIMGVESFRYLALVLIILIIIIYLIANHVNKKVFGRSI